MESKISWSIGGSPGFCLLRLGDPGKHGKLIMSFYWRGSSSSPEAKFISDSWRERGFTLAPSEAWVRVGRGSLKFINDKCLERDLMPVPPRGRFASVSDLMRLVGVGVRSSSRSVFSARAPASPVPMSSIASSRIMRTGAEVGVEPVGG